MKKVRLKKKIKISTKIILIIMLIFFLTLNLFNVYLNKVSPKIITISKEKVNKIMRLFLSDSIGYGILNNNVLDDILIINKNNSEEILYVDYDLEKAYYVLDIITDTLIDSINLFEKGNINLNYGDNNIIESDYGLILKLPLFIASNNALLVNLGPSIYVKVNFIGTVLTNIKSKITNYGMNNALVELYVTVEISQELISPVTKSKEVINYDVLIASKVINGRVPTIYGGVIESESNILTQNLT